MHEKFWSWGLLCLVATAGAIPAAGAATDEVDALNLEAEPVKDEKATSRATRVYAEAAVGTAQQRYGLGTEASRRLSYDVYHASRLAPGWQFVLSDRLDVIRPKASDADGAVNTLREAYVGWQDDAGNDAVELGRVSLRNGPGYGYNPTDFFRPGSQRSVTTVDPIALRDNRMGTVALRAQRLWQGGSLSVAYAPKLASGPSNAGFSLDLGATNNRDRGQVVWGQKLGEGVSGQLLAFKEAGLPAAIGASATALLSEAIVAHVEWSSAREPRWVDRVAGLAAGASGSALRRANRLVTGLTLSAPGGTTVTAEFQYNGFALDSRAWAAVAASGGVLQLGRYLLAADQRLDLAARRAVLVYARKKNLFAKNLDLTALVRVNVEDDSRLSWIELRYQWQSADLALQFQRHHGAALTEFGVLPTSSSAQLVATYRF